MAKKTMTDYLDQMDNLYEMILKGDVSVQVARAATNAHAQNTKMICAKAKYVQDPNRQGNRDEMDDFFEVDR